MSADDSQHVVNLATGNRWSAYKHLYKVLSSVVAGGKETSELESILRRHKPDFVSLMQNPPKSALHRDVVLKAVTEGVAVVQNGRQSRKVVPKAVVEESLLLAEMFDLNELVSLELLITGDHQLPRYPGAARGPVAVLLYLDSRRSLLVSLKMLLQCVGGRTWSTTVAPAINKRIQSFLQDLMQEGVVGRAVSILESTDVQKELQLLQKNRAFGPGKFKRQVIDILHEIRQTYAYIVMAYAAQFGLSSKDTTYVIRLLASFPCVKSDAGLDPVATNLLLAVLFNLDISSLQSSPQAASELQQAPVVTNRSLLQDVASSLDALSPCQLKTLVTLACSVAAKAVNGLDGEAGEAATSSLNEEAMFDEAVDANVFDAVANLLVDNRFLYDDEFSVWRIHSLLTDLPAVFPLKLKELRDRGDESGRMIVAFVSEGIRPPSSLSRGFEKYLLLLSNFYANERNDFASDFWQTGSSPQASKFAVCSKFIRSTVETYSPQILHFSILKLLSSLARKAPFQVYGLLKSSASHHNPQFSLDHLMAKMQSFANSLRVFPSVSASADAASIVRSSAAVASTAAAASESEIELFCAFLQLIKNVVSDKTCAQTIAENHQYNCIQLFVSLISAPVPRKLRASLLSCLAAFASSTPVVALSVWLSMEPLFPAPQVGLSLHAHKSSPTVIASDVEDIEPRNEDYAVTMSFVVLLKSALPHLLMLRDASRQETMDNCVSFMINRIFLKIESRVFKREEDKWQAVVECLSSIELVLRCYDPSNEEQSSRPAFNLMQQVLQENVLFRGIINIIEAVAAHLEPEARSATHERGLPVVQLQEKSLSLALQIMVLVLEKSSEFFEVIRRVPGFPSAVLSSAASLFCNVNPRTSEADRLALLVRLTSVPLPEVQRLALAILRLLVRQEPSVSYLTLLQCQPFKKYHEDYLMHGFVDCIESEERQLRQGVISLLLDLLASDAFSSEYFGLAHKLMGFDRKLQLRAPGALDQSFTCFHSIIAIIDSEPEPALLEERRLALQVVLQLCTHRETRATVLRFLRTSYDLLVSYMSQRSDWMRGQVPFEYLAEVACFWRVLAAELMTAQESQLLSHLKHYLHLLLGKEFQNKLPNLVPACVYSHSQPEMPAFHFFAGHELWNILAACSSAGSVNLKALQSKLTSEVTKYTCQFGSSQLHLATSEMKKIVAFAEQLNSSHRELQVKVDFFKGWRDLVETIIACDSLHFLSDSAKGLLLLDLIHSLCRQSSDSNVIPALMVPVSSIALLATSKLVSCPFIQDSSSTHLASTAKALTNLLEGVHANELWSRLQRARINLYAALLHVFSAVADPMDRRLSKRLVCNLSKDSLDAVDLVKVLSLSILQESGTYWVDDLANDGSLQLVIESLAHDDRLIRANKCHKLSKAFYTFESKMSLLTKLASSERGARTLVHLGIVTVLSSLDCIEVYTYLLNQNEVCYSIFESVMRLLVTLCQSCPPCDMEQLSHFVVAKSPVLYGMLRTTESYRETEEGQKVLFHVTALISRLILHANHELQKTFFAFISVCMDARRESEARILLNVLQGCVTYIRTNPTTPLFLPTWERGEGLQAIGQPTLGLLLRVCEQSADKCKEGATYVMIVESALYLLLTHLDLYSAIIDTSPDEDREIQSLKSKVGENLTPNFFAKVGQNLQNPFPDVVIRRLKRVVTLS